MKKFVMDIIISSVADFCDLLNPATLVKISMPLWATLI